MTPPVREGMEVAQVRDIATQVLALANRTDTAHRSGTAMLGTLQGAWSGDDLARFIDGWGAAGPELRAAAEALRQAGEELRRQADDQELTSDGAGSGGGGGWKVGDFDFAGFGGGFGWDLPDIDWPEVNLDLGGLWEGILDTLEDIGDWWDDLPLWAQIVIGIVAVAIGVVIAIAAGLKILAAIVVVAAIVGTIMTVLDWLDTIAEALRDPAAAWEKLKNMTAGEIIEELVWLGIGFLPLGIGKLLQRFRKPLRELIDRIKGPIKRKLDELGDFIKRNWDNLRRKIDDHLYARRSKQTLDGGIDVHDKAGGHTWRKHYTGITDKDLIDRATPKKGHTPPPGGASRFTSRERAERAIADAIRTREGAIDAWVKSGDPGRFVVPGKMPYPTGRHVPAGGTQVSEVNGINVVLVRDPSMPKGYRIQTAYPTP